MIHPKPTYVEAVSREFVLQLGDEAGIACPRNFIEPLIRRVLEDAAREAEKMAHKDACASHALCAAERAAAARIRALADAPAEEVSRV
jgi:hypothetical protein